MKEPKKETIFPWLVKTPRREAFSKKKPPTALNANPKEASEGTVVEGQVDVRGEMWLKGPQPIERMYTSDVCPNISPNVAGRSTYRQDTPKNKIIPRMRASSVPKKGRGMRGGKRDDLQPKILGMLFPQKDDRDVPPNSNASLNVQNAMN